MYHVSSPGYPDEGPGFSTTVSVEVERVDGADLQAALDDSMVRVLSELFDSAQVMTEEEREAAEAVLDRAEA
jgi:hypothetical protein